MYEAEVNNLVESSRILPANILENFCFLREKITSKTVLPWGEHCTECAWPTCYSTCDLYMPRQDGRCRRFVCGMERIDCPGAVNSYLLKIRFKRWGQLWAPGNIRLLSLKCADRSERRNQRIGLIIDSLPLPSSVTKIAMLKRYSWKKHFATRPTTPLDTPDLFVMECYNPGSIAIDLSLTMRPSANGSKIPYQRLIQVAPGFHREAIAVEEINKIIDLHDPFTIGLIPNEIPDDTVLFFGLIDFIKSSWRPSADTAAKTGKIKCIVWDLDNTLWNGILVEDGSDSIAIKPGIAKIIQDLDERGILHSIASKNNRDEAMAVLKKVGLDEYFLYPQISWGPKSEAVKAIARKLNIGIDSLLFIDDSNFELAEVRAGCPEVALLPADRYRELPDMPECQVPVTTESTGRRQLYKEAATRESAGADFGDDYLGFLRAAAMEVHIEPLSPQNIERVHELTQRTNQMNFSGSRYDRRKLEEIATTSYLDTYVIACHDRFGSYGIVGFSIVDSREPRMTDLMFSCRIQSKRVEHAFLAYLLRQYIAAVKTDFHANYRKTPRNAPSGRVFQDIGMEEREERDGTTLLVFPRDKAIPDDGIVCIVEQDFREPV